LVNKLDLSDSGLRELQKLYPTLAQNNECFIYGSVRWSKTIEEIRTSIAQLGWGGSLDGNRALVANTRQIESLTRAQRSLENALDTTEHMRPIDLLSSDLRDAVSAYGEVTGDAVTEEVLSGIFSRFCVGK
jgi:tRNA modification GTPase